MQLSRINGSFSTKFEEFNFFNETVDWININNAWSVVEWEDEFNNFITK